MPRALEDWVGKTPDTKVPPRVELRVWDRAEGKCHRCTRKIDPSEDWIVEHLKAIINGGENRENNLGITCPWCKPAKDAEDVAEKSYTARVRKKVLGLKKAKHPMPGSKASKWKRKMNGTIERR